ncbi:TetR/AcrR family transcriptional regulator [Thaumasiovibrio subtropicus]|uniref:TetR/AcrR family transcriptional regulator n=1 Tax=Thaumasiovibrio subtropicus TaxID=1891207 RepID=UPI000B363AC4|nr:TetR/AcrR family transcriptional regulator [Thaumasiovibrio subtropicus]
MTESKRVKKSAEERKQELVQAAMGLFFSRGYAETSVNDIIQSVGVSKGAFYHHFESKQAVLEALVDGMIAQYHALLVPVMADKSLGTFGLWKALLETTHRMDLKQKESIKLFAQVMHKEENVLLAKKIVAKSAAAFNPYLTEFIQRGIDEGHFDVEFLQESAAIVIAILNAFNEDFLFYLCQEGNNTLVIENIKRKVDASQKAIERVLDAPKGSLPLVDLNLLDVWFE